MKSEMVTPEMTDLLEQKFEAWKLLVEERKKELPNDSSGDLYALLLLLMEAILESSNPSHLYVMEMFMRKCKSDSVRNNRNSMRLINA